MGTLPGGRVGLGLVGWFAKASLSYLAFLLIQRTEESIEHLSTSGSALLEPVKLRTHREGEDHSSPAFLSRLL